MPSPTPLTTAYLWANELRRQTRSSTDDWTPLPGHQRTPLGAINASGTWQSLPWLYAWGQLALGESAAATPSASSPTMPHRYTGEYWDEDSQLQYNRARWYDPATARFLSIDPFEGIPTNPASLHRYAYAHADPVQGSDPGGMITLAEFQQSLEIQARMALKNFANDKLTDKIGEKIADAITNGKTNFQATGHPGAAALISIPLYTSHPANSSSRA